MSPSNDLRRFVGCVAKYTRTARGTGSRRRPRERLRDRRDLIRCRVGELDRHLAARGYGGELRADDSRGHQRQRRCGLVIARSRSAQYLIRFDCNPCRRANTGAVSPLRCHASITARPSASLQYFDDVGKRIRRASRAGRSGQPRSAGCGPPYAHRHPARARASRLRANPTRPSCPGYVRTGRRSTWCCTSKSAHGWNETGRSAQSNTRHGADLVPLPASTRVARPPCEANR